MGKGLWMKSIFKEGLIVVSSNALIMAVCITVLPPPHYAWGVDHRWIIQVDLDDISVIWYVWSLSWCCQTSMAANLLIFYSSVNSLQCQSGM